MQGLGVALFLMVIVVLVVMLFSLPFAFVGWAIVTFISLFTSLGDFSYWSYAGTGLATVVVLGLIGGNLNIRIR
jgi:hypothetical protein